MSIVDDIRAHADGHAIIREIAETVRGHVRIETAFLYPEGSFVDLFVPSDTTLFPQVKLTDFGQTMQWLLDVQVRPWLSKKRQGYVEDALRLYDVSQEGGALELSLDALEDVVDGVVRLGQACVRVSDLVYTRRSSLQSAFNEEVEEVLADAELDYEPNAELEGRFGTPVS